MPNQMIAACGGLAYNHRVSEPHTRPIDASTRYCAVFGRPIRHSASPAMQNAGLGAMGLNWRYLAFEVDPDDLRAAIAGAKAMRFVGLNLTVPHKLLAMQMVDEFDQSAKTWGAVNTIRFEARDHEGIWRPPHFFCEQIPSEFRAQGFNTDADAIVIALKEDLALPGLQNTSALVLGAGGAGRVAALRLAAEGVSQLFLVNRTASKAEEVATEVQRRYPSVAVVVGYPQGPVDLLLNATSLGLRAGDALPLDERQFALRQARAVYEMIYRPAATPLLQAAKAAGCRTANGLSMLLYQGAKALEIWTGQAAPLEAMRAALRKAVYGN